jgi:hypothetical protein
MHGVKTMDNNQPYCRSSCVITHNHTMQVTPRTGNIVHKCQDTRCRSMRQSGFGREMRHNPKLGLPSNRHTHTHTHMLTHTHTPQGEEEA